MCICMRTTIDLSEAVFQQAKRCAQRRQTTLRDIIEEGLRLVMDREDAVQKYRLKDLSYGSGGTVPGIEMGDWERIRDILYTGRGG